MIVRFIVDPYSLETKKYDWPSTGDEVTCIWAEATNPPNVLIQGRIYIVDRFFNDDYCEIILGAERTGFFRSYRFNWPGSDKNSKDL